MSTLTAPRTARVHAARDSRWAIRATEVTRSMLSRLTAWLRSAGTPKGAAHEARDLRELASSIAHRDPALAADLQAAADRHEAAATH